MRILGILVVILFFLFVFCFGSVFLFLHLKGKSLIIDEVKDLTGRNVTIEKFLLSPSLKIELKNLVIENIFKSESIRIIPNVIESISGKIVIQGIEIIKPEFVVVRVVNAGKAELILADSPVDSKGKDSGTAGIDMAAGSTQRLVRIKNILVNALFIKNVSIKEGSFKFIDKTQDSEPVELTVQDLNANLNNAILLPRSVINNLELRGSIPKENGGGKGEVEISGWANFIKKDIEATIKIRNIDGLSLYPYYSVWVKLDKSRINTANLNFDSQIHGLNNDVTADCHLELTEISFKERSGEEKEERAEKIASYVLGMLKSTDGGKIEVKFPIKTKMDNPVFGGDIIKSAVMEKIMKARNQSRIKTEDIVLFPEKVIQGTVKGATDITKAVIDRTLNIGKELKSVITDSLDKKDK